MAEQAFIWLRQNSVLICFLIVLHTVDGREISIAPAHVNSLYGAKETTPNKLFVESANCLISMTNGKLVTVTEKCSVVRQLLENAR